MKRAISRPASWAISVSTLTVAQVLAVDVPGSEQRQEKAVALFLALAARGDARPEPPDARRYLLLRLAPHLVLFTDLLVHLLQGEGVPLHIDGVPQLLLDHIQPHGCIANKWSAKIVVDHALLGRQSAPPSYAHSIGCHWRVNLLEPGHHERGRWARPPGKGAYNHTTLREPRRHAHLRPAGLII